MEWVIKKEKVGVDGGQVRKTETARTALTEEAGEANTTGIELDVVDREREEEEGMRS